MAKAKKEKSSIKLPKAWASMKHRNETAQAKANFEGLWQLVGTILIILAIAFVLLGGISQFGFIKAIFNWSHNVGNKVSNWMEGGAVIVNEDGVYIDPSGQNGTKISGDSTAEIKNPAEIVNDFAKTDNSNSDDSKSDDSTPDQNTQNPTTPKPNKTEVKNE